VHFLTIVFIFFQILEILAIFHFYNSNRQDEFSPLIMVFSAIFCRNGELRRKLPPKINPNPNLLKDDENETLNYYIKAVTLHEKMGIQREHATRMNTRRYKAQLEIRL